MNTDATADTILSHPARSARRAPIVYEQKDNMEEQREEKWDVHSQQLS